MVGTGVQEKVRLLAGLADYHQGLRAEQERQTELLRMKQERHRVKQEQSFSAAANYLSLAREQQAR